MGDGAQTKAGAPPTRALQGFHQPCWWTTKWRLKPHCLDLCVHTKENLSLASYRSCGKLDFLNFMHVYSIPWPHPSPHPTSPYLSPTYLPFLPSFISFLKITHPIQSVLSIGACVESPPPRHERVTVPPSAAISGL